jgi:hypothetical protein
MPRTCERIPLEIEIFERRQLTDTLRDRSHEGALGQVQIP